ncbi:MAG: hypothetical protein ACFFFH_21555 [Candidatus Thorarchaeota archaeon]
MDYSIQWEKHFGEASVNEAAYSISEMNNDNFIVAGYADIKSENIPSHTSRIELMIVNSSGHSQRITTLSKSHGDFSYTAIQTSDNGLALLGSFSSLFFPQKVNLIKINQEKEIEWNKTLFNCGRGISLIETDDHGFVFACVGKNTASTDLYETKLVKVNSTGNVQWERYFADFAGIWDWKSYSVIQTAEGDYVLLTKESTLPLVNDDLFSQNRDLRLIRLSNSGEVLWDLNVGTSDNEFAREVIQTADGNFVVLGEILYKNNTSSIYLAKISSQGETIIWEKIFPGYNPYSLIQGGDHRLTLLATETSGKPELDSVLIITDIMGNSLEMFSFGARNPDESSQLNFNRAYDFIQKDNYFIVVGGTSSYGPSALVDLWILRIGTNNILPSSTQNITSDFIQLELWPFFIMITIICFRRHRTRY